MRKKSYFLLVACILLAFCFCGCGADSDAPAEETTTSEFDSYVGKPLVDIMEKIDELGYTATYLADGEDFTEFIDLMKEDYTTGDIIVDAENKTIEVKLQLTSNLEVAEEQEKLQEKLEVGSAWIAVQDYCEFEYGSDFELHYLVGKIAEYADDADTWFLKAECTVDGVDMICEAKVTGTTDSPEVVMVDIY